jgi:chorismate synthase
MAGNSFGKLFRITTFGESHGGGVGVVIDGCPTNIPLSEEHIQPEIDRRKPGQSDITTPRKEADTVKIYSGVFEGRTTGTPIAIMAFNQDTRSEDYDELKKVFRPSHADYSYTKKYGFRDWRGSGRASARETLARVAAGAVAQQVLKKLGDVEILSFVEQVGPIRADIDLASLTRKDIESNEIRCPDVKIATEMIGFIKEIKNEGDSIGGVIKTVIRNLPAGLGEPVFNKLNAELGFAMLGINAVKGFEIGSGFAGVTLKGSEHNDPLRIGPNGEVFFLSNHAGGTLGGISTGQDIIFRVAFKSVSTISKEQDTVTVEGSNTKLSAVGRHDPCVLPRAVPIVDAMSALVVLDNWLQQRARSGIALP